MLRLIFYEIRKNYLRRYILVSIVLFVILNTCMIYRGYLIGDGIMGYFMPHSNETKKDWEFYHRMHKQLDGPLTTEKAKFVNEEYNRLSSLTADGTYKNKQFDNTYTGGIFNDYVMISKYFYDPMKYAANYENHIGEVVERAKENVDFYSKYKNKLELAKSKYIVNHYSGRKITVFYDGKPWELLFNYRFSDLLILFLLLLGLVPIYVNEKETQMEDLILSSRKGKRNMGMAKMLSIVVYITFLLLIFSTLNLVTFSVLYRLSGFEMPVYAIEAYQYTPISLSVGSFYILLQVIKLVGFVAIGIWLCFLSTLFQRTLFPYMLSFLLIIGGIFTSGYFASIETGKTILSLLSPFTLLKGNELLMKLLGMNIGNTFVLRLTICLSIQLILLVLLYFMIRLISTRGKLSRKSLFPVKEGV